MLDGKLDKKDDFSKQLGRFSTLVIESKDRSPTSETVIRVTKITPPENTIKNPRRLVLAQGWNKPLDVHEDMLRRMYKNGQPLLTFDHPRAGGELLDLPPDELEPVKEFIKKAPEEIRSARILLEVLASENEVQTNVLAHSRGFAYTAFAALIDEVRAKKEGRPNRIRNIVASAPAGLIGDDSLFQLTKRTVSEDSGQTNWGPDFGYPYIPMEERAQLVSKERVEKIRLGELPADVETDPAKVFEELRAKKAAAEARGIIEYGPADAEEVAIAKKVGESMPSRVRQQALGRLDSSAEGKHGLLSRIGQTGRAITRTYRETEGLANIKLENIVLKLREIGVGVAIAQNTDDKIFPTDRMASSMRTLSKAGVLNISMTGVHDAILRDPRAAHILNGVFTDLEQQRQTTQ